MKLLLLLTVCTYLVIQLKAENCTESAEECNDNEYHSYIACIRRRIKRNLDCQNSVQEGCENCQETCQNCDCDFCAVNTCPQSCNDCCPNNPPCGTNRCCHRTCHARCKSTGCRSDCRKSCSEKITKSVANITTGSEKSRHNITTVINLHNVINNTNVIDIPIQVNNTNVNNITLGDSEEHSGSSTQETCCYVVGPRQCVPTEKYPFVRCFHLRRKVCGPFCRAPIVHEQPHEICDQTPHGTNCHQQIVYIPQPQPRCAYQPGWPYVNCGMQQQQFCGGCYAHYNSPYPQMPPPECSQGCYDDGFGMGPYYRQGPFYRPGYSHTPSCYQTGSCGFYGYGGFGAPYPGVNGYGGYGNGYPAPGFGGYGPYGGFPGAGYPLNSYENNVHFETDPTNVTQRASNTTVDSGEGGVEVEEPPPAYYPAPIVPQYSAVGYPYAPPLPPYKLPAEVDIQATITHPEKDSRYAQITITSEPDPKKREIGDKEKKNSDSKKSETGGEEKKNSDSKKIKTGGEEKKNSDPKKMKTGGDETKNSDSKNQVTGGEVKENSEPKKRKIAGEEKENSESSTDQTDATSSP